MSPTPPAYFNFTTDVMERWASERPDKLALWWVDEELGTERKFTFRQLAEQYSRAVNHFHDLGIRRGDRVLVILPRIPEWWIAVLGLIKLGAVPIPGTPLLTAKDIQYRAHAATAGGIITDRDGAVKIPNFIGKRILVGSIAPNWSNFENGLEFSPPALNIGLTRSDDPGIIYFTSGTTGHPKMVLHTQASYGLGHRVTGEYWLDLKPDDIHWNLSDTGWAKAAWSSLFGPWQMGACVFATFARGRFDPAAALRTLSTYPVTTWCAPPTALRLMVREDLSKCHFPALRHCVSAGEPLNPEVIETWKKATGLTIYEGYGQTETVVLIANLRSRGDVVRPGSMGKPTPGFEVAILNAKHQVLPDGQPGEIAIRVKPQRPLGLFQEYWRNPEENAARFVGDWYLTGDTAYRDADGYFWFVGRADDVIKSSGYRIGPFEVESALIEHPAVLEAAAIAKADDVRGQIVKAFVVLRKDVAASEDLKLELQEHCKRVTAPYKYPREIEFLPELPKTASGKIRRVELRARG